MPKITPEETQVCDERNLKIFEIGSQQHGEKKVFSKMKRAKIYFNVTLPELRYRRGYQ